MEKYRTPLIFLALFLLQIAASFYVTHSLERQEVLTAEESAIALSDNTLFEERYQHNPLATSFGAQFFYWVGYKVAPGDSLFYARYWKAAFMALMSPLLYLYGRRKLGLSEFSAATAATIAGFLPAWVAYVWVCGVGLELVAGLAALLLLDTKKAPLVVLSGALLGFSPLLYEPGFIFFPIFMVELALYLRAGWGRAEQKEVIAAAAGSLALAALVLLSPMIWWVNNPRLYLGGGEIVTQWGALLARNWNVFVRDVFQTSERSYYFFSVAPGVSNPWLAAGMLAGVAATAASWRKWWPIYLLGAMSFTINIISGGAPGIRRVVILLVVFSLGTGALIDWLRNFVERRRGKNAAIAAAIALAATFAVGPVWQIKSTADAFASGSFKLPDDIKFQLLPGKNMAQTVDYMVSNPAVALKVYMQSMEPTRPMGVLYVMASRRGLPSAPEFKKALLDFWRKYEPWYKQFRPTTYY